MCSNVFPDNIVRAALEQAGTVYDPVPYNSTLNETYFSPLNYSAISGPVIIHVCVLGYINQVKIFQFLRVNVYIIYLKW